MVVAFVLRRPIGTWWHILLAATLVVLAGAVALLHDAPDARAAQDPTSCAGSVGLVNGGFEAPAINADSYALIDQSGVPGWSTTAGDGLIEIWRAPFLGRIPAEGEQLAELNATQAATLYQDLPTTPGSVLRWSLQHRGREGVDVMAVDIGPPGGTLDRQRTLSDGQNGWGAYADYYTVPAGQTTTRFAFEAVSTATGDVKVGNLLDDVTFGTGACAVATESVSSSTGEPYAQAGDVLTYTVSAASGGGNPASGAVLTNTLPGGVDYVPGSLRLTTGTTTTPVSDDIGDDQGEYDTASRQLTVRVGNGADAGTGGVLNTGETASISYRVTVRPSRAPYTSYDDASLSFVDLLTGTTKTATTNLLGFYLNPVADVSAGLVRSSADPVLAGSSVTYTATLTSNGQDPAYAARLTSQLPSALGGVTASWSGGTCTVAGGTVTCPLGFVAAGEQRTVTLTGTVAADTPAGSALALTMTAGSAIRDPSPGNDAASVTDSVTVAADLGVTFPTAPLAAPAGADVTYTAVVTNQGPSTARSIRLDDSLVQDGAVPAAPSALSASVPGGTCTTGTESAGTLALQCSLPDLAPGANARVTVVFRSAPDRLGTLTNTATASSGTPETAPADNTATVSTTLTTQAVVGVTITAAPATTVAGTDVTFTAVATNRGPSTARAAVLTDSLTFNGAAPPAGFAMTGSVPGGVCTSTNTSRALVTQQCTLPELAPGASATVTFVVRSVADLPGTLTNTVTVARTLPDKRGTDPTATASSILTTSADLEAVLTVQDTGVRLGSSTTYTVTITNRGPSTAKDAKVTFTLSEGVALTVTQGFCTDLSNCTIAALGVGKSVTLEGTLTVTGAGPQRVTVLAAAATPDPAPDDNSRTVDLLVGAPSIELSVIGAMSAPLRVRGVDVGNEIYWTYVITNAGDVPVSGIGVLLPDGSAVPGGTTCQPGELPPGARTACRSATSQRVDRDDLSRLKVSTTVQATGSWGAGITITSSSATGSVKTVLSAAAALTPTPLPGEQSGTETASTPLAPAAADLQEAAATSTLAAAPARDGSGQLPVPTGTMLLVGAGTALVLRPPRRRRH